MSPGLGWGLMGLFGMPPLLDAEWWSEECVPLCPSPVRRLKGDRYLDTVPRLNDWKGMGETLSQRKPGHLPSQGDMSWSQGGMKSNICYGFRWQWHWRSWVSCGILAFWIHTCSFCKVAKIVSSNPPVSTEIRMFISTQLKDELL